MLVIRQTASGKLVREVSIEAYPYGLLAVSPDGVWVVLDVENQLRIRKLSAPKRLAGQIVNTTPKHFTALAFHPSGRYLAATSNDATVKLYDTATWTLAHTFTWDVGRLRSIAFSPDGLLAAAGSDTGKIVVWDVDL